MYPTKGLGNSINENRYEDLHIFREPTGYWETIFTHWAGLTVPADSVLPSNKFIQCTILKQTVTAWHAWRNVYSQFTSSHSAGND